MVVKRSTQTRIVLENDIATASLKPWHMCEGYGSHRVCYCASGYIPGLYVQREAAYSFL